MRRVNRYRPRACRGLLHFWILGGFGSNDNLDVLAQLQLFSLRFNNGAGGAAGYVLAAESYEVVSLPYLAGLVIDD